MKKLVVLITALAVFLLLAGTAMAAGIDTFFPGKSKSLSELYKGIFSGSANGRKNDKTDTEIIPYHPEYRYAIKQTSKGGYAKVLKGKRYSESTAKKFMKIFNQNADASNYYWFRSKDALPKVAYSGYHVFDERLGRYVDLYMTAEVTKAGKSYNQHPKWKSEGKPYTIALANAANSKFRGLPSLIIIGHGNVEVRISYYLAGNSDAAPSQWTNTGVEYKVKSNITYRDIDAGQAISIKKASSSGFTGYNKNTPYLKFGEYDGFYCVQARSLEGVNKSNDKYWMSYNLDAKSIVMRYTTNQIDYTKSTDKKKVAGKPSGAWTYLGTKSYDTVPGFTLPPPVKKVFDDNKADDIDKTNNTHNYINSSKKGFYYTVTQIIPEGLDHETKYSLSNLTFTDKLDSCLCVDPGDKVRIYKNSISSTNDITKYFTNSSSGKTISYRSVLEGKRIINLNGKGGKIIMRVPVKVCVSDDTLQAHTSDSLRSGNAVHRQGDNAYLDIPNEAKVRSKSSSGDVHEKYTSKVLTRMPAIPRHDIVIKKTVATAPAGENIDADKKFTFTVTLNNGAPFEGAITRADGKKQSITLKKTGTFGLAHGDTLTIRNVPQSTTYTVKETVSERYTPSFHLDSGSEFLTQQVINSPPAGEGDDLSVTDTITKAPGSSQIKYTFTNTKTIKHHDLKITKKTESDEKTREFQFTAALCGLAKNKSYETSAGSKTADEDGKLTVGFGLSDEQTFFIRGLPDGAKYKITEKGAGRYKARFEVTENAEKVTAKNGSGDAGKGVYTQTESFEPDGTDYDISYNVYNDIRDSNDFIIGKKTAGQGADEDDVFLFEVGFEGIPKSPDQTYKSICAEIYEWKGEKRIVNTYPAEEIGNDSYTVQLHLRSGQFAAFTNIPCKTSYHITEKGNDYIASAEGSGKNLITGEALDDVSFSNEAAYKDLTISRTIPEGLSSKYEYTFTNVREAEPVYNRLKTSKTVTNASDEEFSFTAKLHGLEKNHAYVLYTENGDNEYELIEEDDAIRVRTGSGTIGSPYEYIGGIPLKIARNGGETKVIFTSDNVSDRNLEPIKDWLIYKGGGHTVEWIGGILEKEDEGHSGRSVFTGTIKQFAADSNGDAVLDYKMSDDTVACIDGLPKGTSYDITEKANDFAPSYEIKRNRARTDQGEGSKNNDLQTRSRTFDTETAAEDSVDFTNRDYTHMLKTKKITPDDPLAEFDFFATIRGLKNDSYTAMLPGEGDFHVSMDEVGNITLSAENYSGSIEGIPFKLIRPCDGAERICYTDHNGKIPSDEFIAWLSKSQKDSYSFRIEWNGGRICGSFSP